LGKILSYLPYGEILWKVPQGLSEDFHHTSWTTAPNKTSKMQFLKEITNKTSSWNPFLQDALDSMGGGDIT
jgi:hypothetical protein